MTRERQGVLPQSVIEFFRFAVVGVINTMVDFGLFMLLYTQMGIKPIMANILAFLLAVTNSYLLNTKWTFDSSKHSISISGFGRFALLSSGGLAISVTTIVLLDGYVSVEIAKLMATGLTLIWNFTASKLLVYNGVS